MKLTPGLLTGLLALLVCPGQAIERLPLEIFARPPETVRARLSPDGKRLGFLRDNGIYTTVHVLDIDQNKLTRLDQDEAMLANNATKEAESFTWVGPARMVVTTSVRGAIYGVVATDWNGARPVAISGYEDNKVAISGGKFFARTVVHVFNDKEMNILMLDDHLGGPGRADRPDVFKVSTVSGQPRLEEKNPGEVAHWGIDLDGEVRLGILAKGRQTGAIYRENARAPWRTILPLANRSGQMRPLGFDGANNRVIVTALTKEQRWAPFPLDPATGELGEPLLSDPLYDIFPERFTPAMSGVPLVGPIFSQRKKALTGIRYYTETARIKWLDREFAGYQVVFDKSRPDTVNLLVDETADGKRQLWFSYSDQNPGLYSLLDVEKRRITPLAKSRSTIKPEQMATTLGIKYQARDGLLIHGYLTVPVGHKADGKLPLVVMPHGGPWVRDIWGFDPLVQLLANRGYAVLQMNYRGSTGYGDELYQQARKQIGAKIQDDIEDATQWAIQAGVANPQRIAIMGMSYGGYSALFALGRSPGLYRCGISFAGVTDWPAMYEDSDVAESKSAKRYWREQIGDPDKEDLKVISPINFADKITAPVLIIQGKRDARVPQDQARRMIAALEKAGRKPQSLFLADVGHNYGDQKKRAEIYKAMVDFLEKNLGPGVE
jgi:dipeptidyl aminopeptidase/acylaminoacyl peptidase